MRKSSGTELLFLIGVGLSGPDSITVEGRETLKKCDKVYIERYTSFQSGFDSRDYESAYGLPVVELARRDIEEVESVISESESKQVALLIVGDPISATTHNMLRYRAMEMGVKVQVISNASIISAFPAICGLSVYKMGPPVSIPFNSENFNPTSPYKKLVANLKAGFHTLLLLDLKDGKTMPSSILYDNLISVSRRTNDRTINDRTLIIVGSRVGSRYQSIVYGKLPLLNAVEPSPPVSVIVPSTLSEDEMNFLSRFCTEYRGD